MYRGPIRAVASQPKGGRGDGQPIQPNPTKSNLIALNRAESCRIALIRAGRDWIGATAQPQAARRGATAVASNPT